MFAVRITSVLATLLLAFAVAASVAAGNGTPAPPAEKRKTAAPEPAVGVPDPTKKLAPAEPLKLDRVGVVKAVQDEQVLIDSGADKGLKRGDILEVYRIGPPPVYCGRIRLVSVTPHQAVGVAVRTTAKIQVNDHAAREIPRE